MKDLFGYKDKICVVTGTSSGIGEAVGTLLVQLGAEVYALSRSDSQVTGVAKSVRLDLGNKTEVDIAFESLPQNIDCFFGVAGISGYKNDFLTTFNVNFTVNKYITDAYLVNRMSAGSSILYVSSGAGSEWRYFKDKIEDIVRAEGWSETEKQINNMGESLPGGMAYLFSKLAMNYYMVLRAAEFGQQIRVNAVLPGSTDTGMKSEFEAYVGGEEQLIAQAGQAQRLATSTEMAWPAVFLNSALANFVSGEEFYADFADRAMVLAGVKPNQYISE
jgi:NAD(P)-dependent dehydrogenase (short-subunit alcohol dehydrogenase family)